MHDKPSAYAQAGVDIAAANETKSRIKTLVQSTHGSGVLGTMGGFGGLFLPPIKAYDEPVLVSSVDSVGTKLKVAFMTGRHDSVGQDMVNHCANDILVQGAKPLFFLDYLAMGQHDPGVAEAVVAGLATGCKAINCALIGGETAELPDFYQPGEYDLAGTIVGIVERSAIIDGSTCQAGDVLIGLASDGLHTNGFSLARRVIFQVAKMNHQDLFGPTGRSFGDELLIPHRSYVKPVLQVLEQVPIKGMAHITGGGFWDNIPRSLPNHLGAQVQAGSWQIPPIFDFIQQAGSIAMKEMYHVFNMGVGMVIALAAENLDTALEILQAAGETAFILGDLVEGEHRVFLKT
jgi:phosphoribosylformylglycinamidine cyclo-ligase